MRSKTTLRANTNLVERSIEGDVVTLGNELSSVDNTLLHLLFVLEIGELAGDNAQNDILVGGQELEGLKAAGTGGIVF